MRYIRYAFWGVVGICLIAVGLANRDIVTVRLLPEEPGRLVGLDHAVALPLFVVIFLAVAAGLLLGFVWEWIREYRQRADAARQAREMRALRREVERLRGTPEAGQDEVLTLLDRSA